MILMAYLSYMLAEVRHIFFNLQIQKLLNCLLFVLIIYFVCEKPVDHNLFCNLPKLLLRRKSPLIKEEAVWLEEDSSIIFFFFLRKHKKFTSLHWHHPKWVWLKQSFGVLQLLDLSGILTVFFCGIVMSHYTWHNVTESSRITTKYVLYPFFILFSSVIYISYFIWAICFFCRHAFATLSFIAEIFIFLYVGMDALDIEKWRFASQR